MGLSAVILVVFSSFLHAGWNTLGKKYEPSRTFFLMASLFSSIVMISILITAGYNFMLMQRVLPYLVVSGLFQAVYFSGLAGAYQTGELSLAYPLARALPVFFVPVAGFIIGFTGRLPAESAAGMAIVFSGCILLPLERFKELSIRKYMKKYSLFALAAAIGTTGYTLSDSRAMGIIRNPGASGTGGRGNLFDAVSYFALEMLLTFVFLGVFILLNRTERRSFFVIAKNEKLIATITGLMISAAYIIILAAYPLVANVSYITAFRQLSIPLGALAGLVLLKERVYPGKILGTFLVFGGLLLVYI